MRRHGETLRKRYGRAKTEKTTIRVMAHNAWIADGPGPARTLLVKGDRVEVGGPAANRAFLIAHRVQHYGEGWTKRR